MTQSETARVNRLPARYEGGWGREFWDLVEEALEPGVAVLDVGGGRQPAIAPDRRPSRCHYVGLDLSRDELLAAPPGSYEELAVGGAQEVMPDLIGRFDLIVSWQVLEHVEDLRGAADACYGYAREGGRFVALLSGRNAAFALANRVLPPAVGSRLVARLMRRPLDGVFPAYYDHCDDSGLRDAFSRWQDVEVIPLWRGAGYFVRLPPLFTLYVRYEDWTIRRGFNNLATHYVVAGVKRGTAAPTPPR